MATKKACKATTGAGTRCTRKAKEDGYCTQHGADYGQESVGAPVKEITELGPGDIIEPGQNAIMHSPDSPFAKFEVAKRIAHTLAQSNVVPDAYRGRPNDVFVAINMGSELGMGPFQAIQSIAVIEGKPCLYGDGLIGVVRASPKCRWIEESLSEDGKTATCRTQRDGDPSPVEQSYSIDDAVQAGISTKKVWQKHTKRMLQMRARAYCLRDAYPDLLKGLGVVEEMKDHDDTPAPITEYTLPEPAGQPEPPYQPTGTVIEPGSAPGEITVVTLAQVERAMHQSDSMEALLAASNMAKMLTDKTEIGTARVTYKKMKTALTETAENQKQSQA